MASTEGLTGELAVGPNQHFSAGCSVFVPPVGQHTALAWAAVHVDLVIRRAVGVAVNQLMDAMFP